MVLLSAGPGPRVVARPAASRPAARLGPVGSAPADSLEYWLRQAGPAASQPASAPAQAGPGRAVSPAEPIEQYALPGVIELSDGRVLGGWLYTVDRDPVKVFVEAEKRWRLVPLAAVLSITAVIVEEKVEPQWRWKAMGTPQRVYTGRRYPTRRFLWRFRLADGGEMTGAVKGQPIRLANGAERSGPFVLHERQRGKIGQSPADLIYVRRIIISRRLMEAVAAGRSASPAATQAGGP